MIKKNCNKSLVFGIVIIFLSLNVSSAVQYSFTEEQNKTIIQEQKNTNTASLKTIESISHTNPWSIQNNWSLPQLISTEYPWWLNSYEPSIAVDRFGTVHVAWYEYSRLQGETNTYYDIFYKMKPAGGEWSERELVSIEGDWHSEFPSLAVDDSGNVHIAYHYVPWPASTGHYVMYKMKPRGGSWTAAESISPETSSPGWKNPCIAIGTDGTIHIAWEDLTESSGSDYDIFYKQKPSGGSWLTSTLELVSLDSSNYSREPSLAVNATGAIHVVWRDDSSTTDSLHYRLRQPNGEWRPTEDFSPESTYNIVSPGIATENNGTVHVCWQDDSYIAYKNKTGSANWSSRQRIASGSCCQPSLIVDPQCTVHIAYVAHSLDYDPDIFYMMKPKNQIWSQPENISIESTWHSWHPAIAVGPDGYIHAVWEDRMNLDHHGSDLDIIYKKRCVANQTIMVYMAGDNDLETKLIDDFLELSDVESTKKTNVIVQLDRHPAYDTWFDDWTGALRFNVIEGMWPTLAQATMNLGEVNMSDSHTLMKFIRWGLQNYPARKIVLIIAGQANGWRGVATDWTNNSILTPIKVRTALDELKKNLSLPSTFKLDVIGFDGPYTAAVETAYELQNNASYLIASQDITPANGWDYTRLLQRINTQQAVTSEALATGIALSYKETYDPQITNYSISVINLSKINTAVESINALSEEAINQYNGGDDHQRYRLCLGLACASNHTQTSDPSFVDIGQFAANVSAIHLDIGNLQNLATTLVDDSTQAILCNYIKSNGINLYPLHGLSLYFPQNTTWNYEKNNYKKLLFSTTQWDNLLERIAPDNSVLYRWYNHGTTAEEWRGTLIRGGRQLYTTPPLVFHFMQTNERTIPWIHGQVAHQLQPNATLQQAMVNITYKGQTNTTYTDDQGYYLFPSYPLCDLSGDGQLQVRLQDKGTPSTIRVIDFSAGNQNNIVTHEFPFNINNRNALFNRLDFWSLGGRDRDFSVIYHHTMQAVEYAQQILVIHLDYSLPIDIRAYSNNAETFWDNNGADAWINIAQANSGVNSGNRPDNREWHEFSHHIMADSLIGGDNIMPLDLTNWDVNIDDNINNVFDENPCANPLIIWQDHAGAGIPEGPTVVGRRNHWGYVLPSTTDSWVEGFAEFSSCVIADVIQQDPEPSIYSVTGVAGGFPIETGYRTWEHRPLHIHGNNYEYYNREELAIASILWDVYDAHSDTYALWGETFDDDVHLSIDTLWDSLHNIGITNVWNIYNALMFINNENTDEDDFFNLDELFILHGAFGDTDPFEQYNGIMGGEIIGRTGYNRPLEFTQNVLMDNQWDYDYNRNGIHDGGDGNFILEHLQRGINLPRESFLPTPASYLLLHAVNSSSGELINNVTLSVDMIFDTPYENYNYHLQGEVNLSDLQYFEMPSSMFTTTAQISLQKNGFFNPEPIHILSTEFYETGLDNETGYYLNHTFYLNPLDGNNPPNEPTRPIPNHQAMYLPYHPTGVNLTWFGGDPDQEDQIRYHYGLSTTPTPTLTYTTDWQPANHPPITLFYPFEMTPGTITYYWTVQAEDNHGHITQGPYWEFTTTSQLNKNVYPPFIQALNTTQTGVNYTLQTIAFDENIYDQLFYTIDWDDTTTDWWIGPYDINEICTINHTWQEAGTYEVRVRAKDSIGRPSNWTTKTVTVTSSFSLNLNDFPMYTAIAPFNQMCGPAVAQMTLNYMWWNASNDTTPPLLFDDQQWLYTTGHANNTNTSIPYLDMQGLWKLLQTYRPLPYTTYGYNFNKYSNVDSSYMLKQICEWINYTIGTYGGYKPRHPSNVPAIVPAYGDYSNWMAVRGIHTNHTCYPLPSALTIYGFWVNDPLPSGIGANSYKTIAEWITTYYKPMQTNDTYNGKYVAICEPPETRYETNIKIATPQTQFTTEQKQIISLTQTNNGKMTKEIQDQATQWIIQAAINGVNEQLISYDTEFATLFQQTQPGTPLFIQSLTDENYYAVPFNIPIKIEKTQRYNPQNNPPQTRIVILIDATDGSFKEASWTTTPITYLPISQNKAQQLVIEYCEEQGIESKDTTMTFDLVYRQSSPYYPEWRVTIDEYNLLFFVGQDGLIKTSKKVIGGK